jgi:hypothetical protein
MLRPYDKSETDLAIPSSPDGNKPDCNAPMVREAQACWAQRQGPFEQSVESLSLDMKNFGRIATVKLPPGWHQAEVNESPPPFSSVYKFSPADKSDVILGFIRGGIPMTDGAGRAFMQTLSSSAHELTQREVNSLKEMLPEEADPDLFDRISCRTEDLNGIKVLIMEGNYKYRDYKNKVFHVFIPADDTGKRIQQVYFTAPNQSYNDYEPRALESMRSIVWQ